MPVSSPGRNRFGRVLTTARDRRDQRASRAILRAELGSFRTTSELAELSAIAARNPQVDTTALRQALSEQLSR
ncbi:MAG TPA: hypothetical protein VHV79_10380 [Mycobacteriales bacterium]|jgi:hypothetical protein|nr:hypothetical protein [Mycobacteriales bacterium]